MYGSLCRCPYNPRMNDTILRRIDGSVIVAALATVPLVVLDARGVRASWLVAANWVVWLVFLVDFVADFARKNGTGRKLFSFAIVALRFPALPGILSLSRLARLSRLSRIVRLLRVASAVPKAQIALQRIAGRSGIRYLLGITVIAVMSGGGLFSLAEPEAVEGCWSGVWWAIVTATTVGYGDIAPATITGRLIGVILMLVGISLFATLGASVAAYFIESDTEDWMARIEDRLARIEELLKR